MKQHNFDWEYSLAKKGKYICPQCKKKSFVLYVDSEGRMLDQIVGRCDREQKCGYHYHWMDCQRDKGLRKNDPSKPPYFKPSKAQAKLSPSYIDKQIFLRSLEGD